MWETLVISLEHRTTKTIVCLMEYLGYRVRQPASKFSFPEPMCVRISYTYLHYRGSTETPYYFDYVLFYDCDFLMVTNKVTSHNLAEGQPNREWGNLTEVRSSKFHGQPLASLDLISQLSLISEKAWQSLGVLI